MATCMSKEDWDNSPDKEFFYTGRTQANYSILSGDTPTLGKAVTEALRDGWHLHGGLVFDERSGMLVQAVVRNVGNSKCLE